MKMMNNLLIKIPLLALVCMVASSIATAQVGIGTNLPNASLHVYGGTFLSQTPELDPQTSPFYSPADLDDDPVFHSFKWIHEKGAFRALGASIYNSTLDPATVGRYSFASGFDTRATETGAAATGLRSFAGGYGSLSIGQAMIAGNHLSLAQGDHSSSDGPNCVTIGTNLHNNNLIGAFIMGHDEVNAQSGTNNQIKMIFYGGYRLFTTSNLTVGALLDAGANAWSVISDVRKKENFETANGKEVLRKMAGLSLSSWNYKGQDSKTFRHYGAMAQDFFKAFGKDSYGAIGTDTTINQADLDGITLIAIRALVKETDDLERMNDDLQMQLAILRKRVSRNTVARRQKKHDSLAFKNNNRYILIKATL